MHGRQFLKAGIARTYRQQLNRCTHAPRTLELNSSNAQTTTKKIIWLETWNAYAGPFLLFLKSIGVKPAPHPAPRSQGGPSAWQSSRSGTAASCSALPRQVMVQPASGARLGWVCTALFLTGCFCAILLAAASGGGGTGSLVPMFQLVNELEPPLAYLPSADGFTRWACVAIVGKVVSFRSNNFLFYVLLLFVGSAAVAHASTVFPILLFLRSDLISN